MHKVLLLLLGSAALFLTGCADFGEPDENERGPAPRSPDAAAHIPATQQNSLGGTANY